ncbi:Uncharacterised protein [uncultured archaeon]|nr:Uncharacterised protein [uncultured archaeon]
MENNIESRIVDLVAIDRISIPIKSMAGKIDRQRSKIAKSLDLSEYDNFFLGDRVYANVEYEDKMKARGMRQGIQLFCKEFPSYGQILNGMIQEQRALSETHLYFGMNPECRITREDYMNVMRNLKFSESTSQSLYPVLMDVSRKLSRARNEDRGILIG